MTTIKYEDSTPNPEFLIKSIAEQGYSLESALADLIDNSITADADKVEILLDMKNEPFTFFIADNGHGMTDKELKKNMQFPSNSIEAEREANDLGRFGLGMKTASFSQTRCFTVISRTRESEDYSARTWDVEYLKRAKEWRLIVNSSDEVNELVSKYKKLSSEFFGAFSSFNANTIIVWRGLYKFENYITEKKRKDALSKQLTEVTTDYLSIVFHRFMEQGKHPLQIRVNNRNLEPFNPFPTSIGDFRAIEPKQRIIDDDVIKIEGFILPSRCIEESKSESNSWVTKNKGLMDMAGIYIYRADRIILFGDWNGLIKKTARLQLARLRVDVGNRIDHLIHLNVAKSKVVVPLELDLAFEDYLIKLKDEAEKEFYNRRIKKISTTRKKNNFKLFDRVASNKGMVLEVNNDFPLLKSLKESLNKQQQQHLNAIFKIVCNSINKIKNDHTPKPFVGLIEEDNLSESDLILAIDKFIALGLSKDQIKKEILPDFGFQYSTLPEKIINKLK